MLARPISLCSFFGCSEFLLFCYCSIKLLFVLRKRSHGRGRENCNNLGSWKRRSSVTEWCQKCNSPVVWCRACLSWFQHWLLLRGCCGWSLDVRGRSTCTCTTLESLGPITVSSVLGVIYKNKIIPPLPHCGIYIICQKRNLIIRW
jgi:hypothetical protein